MKSKATHYTLKNCHTEMFPLSSQGTDVYQATAGWIAINPPQVANVLS